MTTAPERVRRAMKATAEQITADSVPPLRVPEPTRRFDSQPRRDARRWPGWLAPVAAGVCVAIIAATMLVLSNISHQPLAGPIGQVPPYYAAVTYEGPLGPHIMRNAVTIRSTVTGQVLATAQSQAPLLFQAISGAADDRTFVAAAAKPPPSQASPRATTPVRFYLVRFEPASNAVTISHLPITNVTEGDSSGPFTMALSPDARQLAVATGTFHGIRVYSLPTGAEHSWVTSQFNTMLGLSWAPDNRTLAFFFGPGPPGSPLRGVHLLDTASQEHGLLSASRQVRVLRPSQCGPPYLLPQKSTIVCTIPGKGFVARISLESGKVLRRFDLPSSFRHPSWEAPLSPPEPAWAGQAGAPVIIFADQLLPRPYGSTRLYVLTKHGITKLPRATWPLQFTDDSLVAW